MIEEDGSEVDKEYFEFLAPNAILQLLTMRNRLMLKVY